MLEYRTSIITPFCDSSYYLSSEYSMHFIQETTGRMAARCNCDIPELLKENRSWVVLSVSVDIYCKPYWMTDVVLEGYYFQPVGRFVPRRTCCRMPDGAYAFKADSLWGVVSVGEYGEHRLIDPSAVVHGITHDIMKPDDTFASRYRRFDMDSFGTEIYVHKHKVLPKDCDINGHVNNLKYIEWAVNHIPQTAYDLGRDISKIEVCYVKELHVGETIDLKYACTGNRDYYVSIGDAAFAHFTYDFVPRIRF